jgi:DoxX-like family
VSLPFSSSLKTMTTASTQPASKGLSISLWIVQSLLALTFVGTGIWKLATPLPELAAKMPWMGQVSPSFLQVTALFDILGGLGVLLPSITRIKPRLVVLGALGCVALMAAAIVFHVSRGEAAKTPFNVLLVALSLFVAWGRRSKAPIEPRT